MQEGIIQIGKVLMEGSSILDNLISDVPSKIKDKQLHVLKFMFSSLDNSVKLDPYEEMSEESSKKYLFIRTPKGNVDQWYATTTNNFYHLSQTISNLSEKDFGEELNKKIKSIKESNFIDLGDNFKSNKNRYIFNFEKLNNSKWSQDSLKSLVDIKDEKKTKENIKKEILRVFKDYLKENYDLGFEDIGLYTIFIDGKPLSRFEEYKKVIIKEKQGEKEKKSKLLGKCYYCQSDKDLRDKIKLEVVKSYTTNLNGFANNVNKNNYKKNMILCKNCLSAYLTGETFIKNILKTNIAKFSVYIYPHFILGKTLSKDFLENVCKKISTSFNTIANYKKIKELNTLINEQIFDDFQADFTYYSLNILFYKDINQGMKVQRLIKDINPYIIEKIANNLFECEKKVEKYYGINNTTRVLLLNLEKIYYLIPIRIKKNDVVQFRSLLSLYECIFTTKPIDKNYIIKNINSCLKIIYYDEKGFNVSSSNNNNLNFINTAIKGNMLIKFLMLMGNIKGGQGMDVTNLKLDEELKQYIKEMGYTEEETALFLLGTLVGNIGTVQYNRNKESGKKPILNKINFSGIDKTKLHRFSNDIFEKLKQEKILKNNEIIFQQHKELLDKNFKKWSLNKDENLFYILSGYSYASMKAITSKKNGGEKNEQ